MHGLIHSHIDFCDVISSDIPSYQIGIFQKVQIQAARIVNNSSFDQSFDLTVSVPDHCFSFY